LKKLSHLDARGKARMVDVSKKPPSEREATASCAVLMKPETVGLILEGGLPKGDVIAVARVAGIMAAKRTPELIPLCHTLPITSASVEVEPDQARGRVEVRATVKTVGQTGVEMEALTAASVAALAVYDMCKAADKEMAVTELVLREKKGGRGGHYKRG
jgi:cyclic pyranopterin phosphate synthase